MTTQTALAEVVDNETGEVTPRPAALARVAPGSSRLLALESMSETDFDARLALLRTGQARMRRIQEDLLVENEDYGVIPGTGRGKPGDKNYSPGKATLLKPGAEKLLKFYGLVATFVLRRTYGDGVTAPMLHVDATCLVHVGDADGPVIAQGDATCNTWERKYRYRKGQNACPSCGSVIIRTKRGTPKEQWWCPPDKGGCGANYAKDDAEIAAQVVGDVENPDQRDLDNTCVKIAVKRSLVAGSLLATATSGLFTQDMEDAYQEPRPERQAEAVAPHPSTPAVNVQALVDGFAASTDGATYRAACKAVEAVWGALDGDARNATQAARDTAKARILASRPATTDLAPISEPLEQAAKRAAIAASLRTESRPFGTYDHEDNPITGEPGGIPDEPDEPPTDEELAEALWSPVVNANPKDEAQLTALWAAVMTSPSYKAATEGARRLAAETIEGVRATLRDAKPKGGRK